MSILIITIIILLILSGIIISQLAGNGILSKVEQAKGEYKNAQQLENSILNDYQSQIAIGNRQDVNFSTTELLKEPFVVATSTTATDRSNSTKLEDSIANYEMLLFTFGNWDNTAKTGGKHTTQMVSVKNISSLVGTTGPILLSSIYGANYSEASLIFVDNENIAYKNSISSNTTTRKHFAITSILGIK